MLQTTRYAVIEPDLSKTREERVHDGIAAWTSFYRENPHRFVKDFMNVNLKDFQQINLIMLDSNIYSVYIASRGQGKSFLLSVYCCERAVLYPGTKICIAAGRRSQSINILEYIQNQLVPNSKNLEKEIRDIRISQSSAICRFWNGSYIKVVTAGDSGRGERAHILIMDEYRIISEEVVNTILRKFTSDERHPPYRDNPEYSWVVERNKQIYSSSAWFKDHWSYKKAFDYYNHMVVGNPYFVCGIPYQLPIKEGLYRAEQAQEEMSESTFNESQWRREMCCEWTGDTDGAFYNYEAINRTRQIKFPLLPRRMSTRFAGKSVGIPTKKVDEYRILSVDIALMRSKKKADNDATAIFINQMMPNAHGRYYSNFVYGEIHEGEKTQRQALRIRRLYDEYDIDYIIIDGKGAGAGVVDLLLDDIYDQDTGEVYGALSCYNNPEFAARCTDIEAPKSLWVINNQTAKFNSECAFLLREGFRSGKIRLLVSEYDAEESLSDIKGWGGLNPVEKEGFRYPYKITTALVDELINLKYENTQNGIKIYEKSGFRKDMYSSISYNYWLACQLEERARKKSKNVYDIKDILRCKRAPKIK